MYDLIVFFRGKHAKYALIWSQTQIRALLFFCILSFLSTFATKTFKNMCKDLFDTINTTIRGKRLYADIDLMREDVMHRFGISRHHLNHLLNDYANGLTFPQYINSIRLEEAHELLTNRPNMTITEVARIVGFTASNLREQFKRSFGITPAEYRERLKEN